MLCSGFAGDVPHEVSGENDGLRVSGEVSLEDTVVEWLESLRIVAVGLNCCTVVDVAD